MFRIGFIGYLSVVGRDFEMCFFVVCLDGLLQIVDVDQLNVQLVLEMFKVGELFFGELFTGCVLEVVLKMIEFVAQGM